jgi:hypothetical protein
MYLFHIIQKIVSTKLTKLLITLIILFFLFKKIDFFTIKNNILNLNIYHWILYLLLSLPIPLLFIFKWVYYLKTPRIKILYFNFVKSIGLSDILNTSLFIEIFKFNTLKNISLSRKISRLIIEKFFVLSSKTIITLVLLWIYIYNYYSSKILIYSLLILPLFFLLIRFDITILYLLKLIKIKFNLKIIKTVQNAIDSFKHKFKIIFLVDTLRNVFLLTLYFFILINFFNNKTVILILIFLPFLEALLKILTFSFFGLREVLIYYMGGLLNIDQLNIVTASVILSFNLTLINILLLTILAVQNYLFNIKKI